MKTSVPVESARAEQWLKTVEPDDFGGCGRVTTGDLSKLLAAYAASERSRVIAVNQELLTEAKAVIAMLDECEFVRVLTAPERKQIQKLRFAIGKVEPEKVEAGASVRKGE